MEIEGLLDKGEKLLSDYLGRSLRDKRKSQLKLAQAKVESEYKILEINIEEEMDNEILNIDKIFEMKEELIVLGIKTKILMELESRINGDK